ncbi:alpha-ribazole phosphatase [Algivirga pacifica]|uniref:Alpha-ribazole phosphatase n=1 Tax=Algivirga pacifica TaxID=1162670 RepID=A0ABP9DG67_9BACT
MEVYLIRHTTPDVPKGICYGQTDLNVHSSFLAEVNKIRKQFPYLSTTVDKVFSSPLQRCTLLAKELFPINIPLEVDDRLKELNFGEWEMKAWDEIPLKVLQPWMDDFVHTPTLGGESYLMLYQRLLQFIEDLKSTDLQKVVIVTHSGVIRAFKSYYDNTSLENSFEYQIPYGSVCQLIDF